VAERNADDIQRDIEQSRAALAEAVDELAYRTNPKRVANNAKQSLREKAQTTQGRIAIGVAGGVLALLIVRRVRNARR
jgi:predicted O-methyltransferase YrrM